MIKVLHIITGLNTGGSETVLCRLVSSMDRSRFSSAVVSMLDIGQVGARIRAEGTTVHALGMRRGVPNPAALWRLRKIINRERPHIIQTWMYHANLLGLVSGRLCGVPAILWNVRCSNMDMRHYRKLSSIVIRISARLSSLPETVVVNSEAGRLLHEEMGYRPREWKVIPNGFDLAGFRPDPGARTAFRKELGVGEDSIIIGMVARFDPMKDHENFLNAAACLLKKHHGAHFVLAGSNVDGDNKKLADLISYLGIGRNVHLMGERSDIPAVTAGFDIAASSSYGEGFPNVVGEAMACGVPCVVTDTGDSSLIVGDTGRVVRPKDPGALASAWGELIDMGREGRSNLGLEARARIEKRYSLSAVVAQYEELYGEYGGRTGRFP